MRMSGERLEIRHENLRKSPSLSSGRRAIFETMRNFSIDMDRVLDWRDPHMRAITAGRKNISLEALRAYARDDSPEVRAAVESRGTPLDAYETLSRARAALRRVRTGSTPSLPRRPAFPLSSTPWQHPCWERSSSSKHICSLANS